MFLPKLLLRIIQLTSNFKVGKVDLDLVIEWVLQAEKAFERGEDKSAYVKNKIRTLLKVSAPYLVDLLVSLAVGYLGKQGKISLNSME